MDTRKVRPFDLGSVRYFLERHVETSMFLLANLDAHGIELGDAANSGNFKLVEQAGEIQAVFCLARRGNLLLQTGGRTDLAEAVLAACADEPIRIQGIVGEWRAAQSVWKLVCADPEFCVDYESRERLYRFVLGGPLSAPAGRFEVVRLAPEHAAQWEPLNLAYLQEEGLPIQGTRETRIKSFQAGSERGHWWGALRDDLLVSIAGLNAVHRELGQVGGVYTRPDLRGRGFAGAVINRMLADCRSELGLSTLILFTGERNAPARRVYERAGFEQCGEFALLFGTWLEAG